MRSALRALSVSALLAALVLAPAAGTADAAGPKQLKPKVLQSNWFWYQLQDGAPVVPPEELPEPPEPSLVPDGALSVAYTGGTADDPDQPSKQTFLAFDLDGVKPGSSVTSFTFTLTVHPRSVVPRVPPVLVACLAQRLWSNGAGDPWSDKPPEDCSPTMAAVGEYDEQDRTYTFKVAALAQQWVDDVNTGVGIRHQPADATEGEATPPFQLNFTGPASVQATMRYLPGVPLPPTTVTPQPTTAPSPTPAAGDGGSGTGTSGGLTPAGPAGSTGGTDPQPQPSAAPTPQVAPQPVAASSPPPPASSWPTPPFWAALVGLALLLAFMSLVLGDPRPTPVPARNGTSQRSRLDRILRSHRPAVEGP